MRRGRKRREDVYSTNYERLSSYPSYKSAASRETQKPHGLRPGMIVKIRVSGVDDEGRPLGQYMGYTIIVEGVDVEPGIEMRVKIGKVEGNTALAKPAERG